MNTSTHILDDLPTPREIGGVTRENFPDLLAKYHEPLVFRQIVSDWNIVSAGKQSPEAAATYLKQFDTGQSLPLLVSPAKNGGRLFYNETLDGFNFSEDTSTVSSALDRMLKLSGHPDGDNIFLQSQPIAIALPGLANEIPNPLHSQTAHPFIWIGSKIRVAPHFDETRNIAFVAVGRRRFTLFPPEQVSNLYIGRLDYAPAGLPISLVDVNAPDFNRFPKFRYALDSAISVELEPGDGIYIPTPWWHQVESLDSLNVLVNFWWGGARVPSAMPFTTLLHAIQAFRHLPAPERKAWKAILDYYAFEAQGNPAEHLPTGKAGILEPMTPQLAQHIQQWLQFQIGRDNSS